MKRLFAALGFVFVGVLPSAAQNPQFPQTLPANSVVGRTGVSAGPAQAIPFNVLGSQIFQSVPAGPSQGLVITQNGSGAVNQNQFAFNSITLSSDSIANNAPISFPLVDAFLISHTFGGSTFKGTAQALEVDLNMTSTTSASNPSRNYPALEVIATATANDTGTGISAQGALFGVGAQAILSGSGATFWNNVTAAEFNTGVVSGASVAIKSGIQIANEPTDAVQGSTIDAAIWLQSQSPTPGWKNAFLIGGTGSAPMASSGCIICTTGNNGGTSITTGVDLSSYTITGNFLNGGGFSVSGTGNIASTSATSTAPFFELLNTTSDANASLLILAKNRSGGNTNSGDLLGTIIGEGFANTSQRLVAEIQFLQAGASSGSNIPSKLVFLSSTSAGLLNNSMTFDNNAHLTFNPAANPTVGTCAGGAVQGSASDLAGRITFTSGTSCSITFGVTYTVAPACMVSPGSAASTVEVVSTTGGFTATFGTAQTGMGWICSGGL